MVPLLILGVLAGAKSAWHLAVKTLEQERREDEAVLNEQQSQRERTGISRPKQPSRVRKELEGDALAQKKQAAGREADEKWNC